MKGRNEFIGAWPRLMRAKTAAAYCDETSVDAFRRGIGKLWPLPRRIPGKGERWLREELDLAIDKITTKATQDAADLL